MKRGNKRLSVHRETIRRLDVEKMKRAAGGWFTTTTTTMVTKNTCQTYCEACEPGTTYVRTNCGFTCGICASDICPEMG